MPENHLVSLQDTLDLGRQKYNEAVTTFYDKNTNRIPKINGFLKTLYNPEGKARLYGLINGKWIIFAYEDPIPTDIMYYDPVTETLRIKANILGQNADFANITSTEVSTKNFESLTGKVNTLTVNVLNVVDRINQTTTQQLVVEDNTILLNSNLKGNPDEANFLYAGLVVNRGNLPKSALRWDETKDRWLLDIPAGETDPVKTVELFGIIDDLERKAVLKDSYGIWYDKVSASRNPGSYISHEDFISGIYWDKDIEHYVAKDKTQKFELVGIDLLEPGRKLNLNNSTGIQNFNSGDLFSALDFIHNKSDGSEDSRGSVVYDHIRKKIVISTENKTFELKDIDEIEPFGDSWYYSEDLIKGQDTILLPASKPIYNTDEGLVQVYVNGVHIRPDMYRIIDQNRLMLNEPVKETSTITIYHHVFMSENYRLPLKSIPNYVTGITGKEFYVSHSDGAITGELQSLVIKNNRILVEKRDYTLDRITETTTKVKMVEDLVVSDEVIVYPILTPNIFVKGKNALVFDTHLVNPGSTIEGTAHILFRRGSLPAAGIRWNESNNTIEGNDGTGIWTPLIGTSTKFDRRRFVIESESNKLDISRFLQDNHLTPTKDLYVTVFKNGFQMDDPDDYTLENSELMFTNPLSVGDKIWVYLGKSFIKSCNHLINKKEKQVITEDTTVLVFKPGFEYEPGTDSLNIFVNGILTEKDIDYIELSEKSVMFNYKLEKGAVIQVYTPMLTDLFHYTKKIFEFDITDTEDFLNSAHSNCFISVNRGAAMPAAIKWDEEKDNWYLTNGDGKYKRIVTSETGIEENKEFVQVKEYTGVIGNTLIISDMIGTPDKLIIFLNGKILNSIDYSYNKTEKKISFIVSVNIADRVTVIAYASGELQYVSEIKDLGLQKISKTLADQDEVDIDLTGNLQEIPYLEIFINGVLLNDSKYSTELSTDKKKLTIKFVSKYSGEFVAVVAQLASQQSMFKGSINELVFNRTASFEDNSPLGNWYIKAHRDKLPIAYIKWDEVDNNFKFNRGTNREYTFAKVVFANDFFTPEDGEELILIHKGNNKAYAYYNSDWHEM